MLPLRPVLAAALVLALSPSALGSYGFYIGKNLSADGSVLIGGTGEEVSSHWLVVVPAAEHPAGTMLRVGVTAAANIPGELIEIPQVRRTTKFIATYYSDYKGFLPPLTNGGLNQHGVAVRDIWSPSRQELVAMTETPQRGVNYSDLSRIVLERARTAREGVEIIGELIAEHGYATYGGNSHLIADANEGWVVIELAGGQGLWAAERLGPDDVRVSYPGYIGEMPTDYLRHPDFMGSENLISFAAQQGWYDPDAGVPFDFHQVYGAQGRDMRRPGIKFVDPATLEDELLALAPKITLRHLMAAVRDARIADDEAGYGQAVALRPGVPAELQVLWVAPTGSVTAPFVPFFMGITEIPPQWGEHRYLTKDAGRTFLSTDYQAQEATAFAGRLFKRLMYYTCERPEKFLPEVTEALQYFETRRLAELPTVRATAAALLGQGRNGLAGEALTRYSNQQAEEAIELGEALLASIEARTELIYGIRRPRGTRINEAADGDRVTVTCRSSVDREGPVVGPGLQPDPPPMVEPPSPAASAPDPAPAHESGGGFSMLLWGVLGGCTLGAIAGFFARR